MLHVCLRACVRVCVRACMRTCVRVYACSDSTFQKIMSSAAGNTELRLEALDLSNNSLEDKGMLALPIQEYIYFCQRCNVAAVCPCSTPAHAHVLPRILKTCFR